MLASKVFSPPVITCRVLFSRWAPRSLDGAIARESVQFWLVNQHFARLNSHVCCLNHMKHVKHSLLQALQGRKWGASLGVCRVSGWGYAEPDDRGLEVPRAHGPRLTILTLPLPSTILGFNELQWASHHPFSHAKMRGVDDCTSNFLLVMLVDAFQLIHTIFLLAALLKHSN